MINYTYERNEAVGDLVICMYSERTGVKITYLMAIQILLIISYNCELVDNQSLFKYPEDESKT